MVTRRDTLRQMGRLAGTALAATVARAAAAADPAPHERRQPAEGLPLNSRTLIWDNHSGFDPRPDYDLEHLEQWRRAGVDFLSIDVGYDVIDWQLAIENLGSYIAWFEKHPDRFQLVRRADDVMRAKQAGRMAITFDLEGMSALNGRTSMVSLYYRLGVRQMLIAYNRNNLAGGGCHDDDHGLTEFGRAVIAEMNRVGMLVDCSHTGHRTTLDVMGSATQPVIFSHSNPKSLRAHGRNITDDQIRACARTGGVIGINGIGLFLPRRASTAEAMIDCIVYVRELAGPDHVGIGLDYSPASIDEPLSKHPEYWPPAEYGRSWPMKNAAPDVMTQIATGLRRRGWPASDIDKAMGGNLLRVAQAVWK